MIKHFSLLVGLFVIQNTIGQCKLTIIQEGPKCELMNKMWIGNYPDIQPIRINDSTLEFTYYLTEPVDLFILLDKTRHGDTNINYNWKTHIWIDPEIRHRELIINYSTKKIKIKDDIKWRDYKTLDEVTKLVSNDLHQWDSINQLAEQLHHAGKDSEVQGIDIHYIEQHPDSYFSLWLFSHSQSYTIGTNEKQALFSELNPELSKYPEYHEIKADISGARKYPNIGDTFKEFTLTDFRGRVFNSKTIKNKWILLHFWSNGCGPCVKEMDAMVNYYNTLDTSKIAFISIALDDSKTKWEKAPTTPKIKWTNLWEPDNFYGDLTLNYNVYSMPFFVLFNNEKKLVIIQDGADAIETTIKGYLSKVK